jgi:glutamine amidotransferase
MVNLVTVIDLGMGNLGAIPNMLRRLGVSTVVTADAAKIDEAARIVLPGVGSFDTAMAGIERSGIRDVLEQRVIRDGTPLLGICLGMEILGDASEEGDMAGLGWIPGRVIRFRLDPGRGDPPVPHMGWNHVETEHDSQLLHRGEEVRFYFAHSYHFEASEPADVIGRTTWGYRFDSAVQRKNVMGVQFHPEKSHRFGLELLRRFVES